MEYLFDKWENIKLRLRGKYIFIFFDYDGTLTPIVETPDKAILSETARNLLLKMSRDRKIKLAFISGRSLKDIKNKMKLKNVVYSGNHGLEIEGPNIKFEPLVSPRYQMIIRYIKEDLNKRISSIKGAFIEDKGVSLSLHYRLVTRGKLSLLRNIFNGVVNPYLVRGKVSVKKGKMVLEVAPAYKWSKADAVMWLLKKYEFVLKRAEFIPIYIGDDLTDESAFKALKNKGLTICVGRTGLSEARYYLKDSSEVTEFLQRVLEI
ncbi:MAG: trehalose-phosphatase [Candidatus Omnitrophota bacterium]